MKSIQHLCRDKNTTILIAGPSRFFYTYFLHYSRFMLDALTHTLHFTAVPSFVLFPPYFAVPSLDRNTH